MCVQRGSTYVFIEMCVQDGMVVNLIPYERCIIQVLNYWVEMCVQALFRKAV